MLRIVTNDWTDDANTDTVVPMIQQANFGVSPGDSGMRTEIYCAAEVAECNCPDACERDHGNE